MKKLLFALLVLLTLGLIGCGETQTETEEATTNSNIIFENNGNYTVEVIEAYDDGFYNNAFAVKKTSNYAVGGIWILVAYDFEYEVGDEVVVKWFGNDYCVPLVEYIDQTIDGYIFGMNKYGLGWYVEEQDND